MFRRQRDARRRAFTITEVLISTGVIAVLTVIALPAVRGARDSARTAKAMSIQRQLQTGTLSYIESGRDWIPGINTSGRWLSRCVRERPQLIDAHPTMPVQDVDWITPSIADDELPRERAARFAAIFDRYADPTFGLESELYTGAFENGLSGTDDMNDWLQQDARRKLIAPSYLMPIAFQLYGGRGSFVSGNGMPYYTRHGQLDPRFVPQTFDAVTRSSFQPKLTEIGAPSMKIANATGLRYYNGGGRITTNAAYAPERLGAFTTWGAIYSGSESYGQTVPDGSGQDRNETNGEQSPYVYRHGGKIVAVFFDGHAELLDVESSQNPSLWYPRGSVMGRAGTSIVEHAFAHVAAEDEIP